MSEDGELKDFENLCAAIGFISVNWALTENFMDSVVLAIYQDFGGRKIERSIPRSLNKKIDFCRKAIRRLPSFSRYGVALLPLLNDMETLSEKRHDFIHGVVTNIKRDPDGTFPIMRLIYGRHEHTMREIKFDPNDFPGLVQDIQKLQTQMGQFSLQVEVDLGRQPR